MNKGLKEEKRIAVVIFVGCLVVIGIFVAKWIIKRKEEGKDFTFGIGRGGSEDNSSGNQTESVFPLKKGSRGAEVKHLQGWLNATSNQYVSLNYDPLVQPHDAVDVDSIFGPKTEAALLQAINCKTVSEDYYKLKNMKNF